MKKLLSLLCLISLFFVSFAFGQTDTSRTRKNLHFEAADAVVKNGEGTYVRWTSIGFNSLEGLFGANGWEGTKLDPSGSIYTGPLFGTTTYAIKGHDDNGGSETIFLTVEVDPSGMLEVPGGGMAVNGYYKIPIYFYGNNVVSIDAEMVGEGLTFPKDEYDAVEINEWPYNYYPYVEYDQTSSDDYLHWGLVTRSSPMYGVFSPVTVKTHIPDQNQPLSAKISLKATFISGDTEHIVYPAISYIGELQVFSGGEWGGDNDMLSVIKSLDLASGKTWGVSKENTYLDVDGYLGHTADDSYMIFLRMFNRIKEYPVKTGNPYWYYYEGTGEIEAREQAGNVILTFSDSLKTADLELTTPLGKEIRTNTSSSLNVTGSTTRITMINNESKKVVVTIQNAKLKDVKVRGLINRHAVTVTETGSVTEVAQNSIPQEFVLSQNYPNPFNPSTTIDYQLPQAGMVTIKVYDVLGNEIVTLVNEEKPAGSYEINFNAGNLSSGLYIYRIQSGNFVRTKMMTLLK